MSEVNNPPVTHYWTPTVAGQGRILNRPTKIHQRTYPVTLVRSNPFEPVRVRVRLANGELRDVDPCELVSTYRGDDLHKHGIVSWELACGCPYSSLSDDSSARGTLVRLQPTRADGQAFFPAAEYIIERVSWPCPEQDTRASVAVRVPGEESWRGRSIMVDVDALELAIREKVSA